MAVKLFAANVTRVHVDSTGKILVRLRSDTLPADGWYTVPFGSPGANTFLAIALSCVTTGMPAEVGLDEPFQEFSRLHRIEIVLA